MMRRTEGLRASETDDMDAATTAPEDGGTIAGMDLFSPRPLSRDDGPLYRQMVTILRAPIVSGVLSAGASLPREADLAERFGVSLITVRQALRELENEGLIRKRAAKPAVVAGPGSARKPSYGFKSFAEIAASTTNRRLEIHSYRKERSVAASSALGLAADDGLYCLRATLLMEDVPTGLTTFYFPPAVGARMKRSDFDDVVVFRSVQRHLGIKLSGARITVRADTADEALANALDYHVGGAILVIEMLYLSESGEPVELTINRNRADLFSLSYDAPNDLV